jgi:hypothetical protein
MDDAGDVLSERLLTLDNFFAAFEGLAGPCVTPSSSSTTR